MHVNGAARMGSGGHLRQCKSALNRTRGCGPTVINRQVGSNMKRRRLVGTIFLGIAVLMVVVGEFALHGADPYLQITYWFICFLFTGAAMLVAVVDLLVVRTQSRQQRRELLEATIREVEEEQRQRNART